MQNCAKCGRSTRQSYSIYACQISNIQKGGLGTQYTFSANERRTRPFCGRCASASIRTPAIAIGVLSLAFMLMALFSDMTGVGKLLWLFGIGIAGSVITILYSVVCAAAADWRVPEHLAEKSLAGYCAQHDRYHRYFTQKDYHGR